MGEVRSKKPTTATVGFTGQYCVPFSCVLFVVFMPTVPMCKYMLFWSESDQSVH